MTKLRTLVLSLPLQNDQLAQTLINHFAIVSKSEYRATEKFLAKSEIGRRCRPNYRDGDGF